MNCINLHHKRILVTGASSGIGRACAICASQLGAEVVATGRRLDALDETLAHCEGRGHQSIAGDITSPAFIKELVDFDSMTAEQKLGYCKAIFVTANVTADELAEAGFGDDKLRNISYEDFTSLVYTYGYDA